MVGALHFETTRLRVPGSQDVTIGLLNPVAGTDTASCPTPMASSIAKVVTASEGKGWHARSLRPARFSGAVGVPAICRVRVQRLVSTG